MSVDWCYVFIFIFIMILYTMDLIKLKWAIPVVLFCLLKQVETWNKFCSVLCSNQQCNSTAFGSCTGSCASPWTWNSTTNVCDLLPASGWGFVDASADAGGGLSPSSGSTSTCGPQSGGSQWSYSYTGNQTGNDVVTYTDTSGVSLPHYQLRIIAWVILIDDWQGQDNVKVTLDGTDSQTQSRNSRQTNEKTCGNGGNWEDYVRFDKTYTHNISTPFTIDITTTGSNSRWGVKEVVVIARLCHAACLSCFGGLATQCYSCEQ